MEVPQRLYAKIHEICARYKVAAKSELENIVCVCVCVERAWARIIYSVGWKFTIRKWDRFHNVRPE